MAETKKLFIRTYGCQMNVYDSERMAEALGGEGYVETDTPDDADMVMLNTCHIREKAAEKVYSELGRYKALKAGEAGAQDRRRRLRRPGRGRRDHRPPPMVDLVVGPQTYHRLPEMVEKAGQGERWSTPNFRPKTSSTSCETARRPSMAPPPS